MIKRVGVLSLGTLYLWLDNGAMWIDCHYMDKATFSFSEEKESVTLSSGGQSITVRPDRTTVESLVDFLESTLTPYRMASLPESGEPF